jgi:Na+-driven multidrug efflux pump
MLYTKEMIFEIENKKLFEKIIIFYSLAIPNIVGFLGRVILNLTDLIMIGTLGTLSVAGSGLAIFITSIAGDFLIAIGSPVLTLAARRFGEGKSEESGFILTEAIVFSLKIGIPLSILGTVFSPFIMQLVNSNPGIISEGNKYLVVRNAGWFILMLYYAFQGYYNGIGKPNAYLINISIITVINVVLNWLLIYGIGIFPQMGVMGASLATVISLAIGVIIFIVLGVKE